MKNFIEEGKTLKFAKASVVSGDPVVQGAFAGVAVADTDADGDIVIQLGGVYDLSVNAAAAVSIGTALYHTGASTTLTTTSSGNTLFGYAREALASGTDVIAVQVKGQL